MSDAAPLIVLMPGAGLMKFATGPGGLRVSCPGCGASRLFRPTEARYDSATFEHETGCPVHARIQAAIAEYERRVVKRG